MFCYLQGGDLNSFQKLDFMMVFSIVVNDRGLIFLEDCRVFYD